MGYQSTRQVAELLRINPSRLTRALWEGRVTPPGKSPSGTFLWTVDDIRRAAWQLLSRDLDDILSDQQEAGR